MKKEDFTTDTTTYHSTVTFSPTMRLRFVEKRFNVQTFRTLQQGFQGDDGSFVWEDVSLEIEEEEESEEIPKFDPVRTIAPNDSIFLSWLDTNKKRGVYDNAMEYLALGGLSDGERRLYTLRIVLMENSFKSSYKM